MDGCGCSRGRIECLAYGYRRHRGHQGHEYQKEEFVEGHDCGAPKASRLAGDALPILHSTWQSHSRPSGAVLLGQTLCVSRLRRDALGAIHLALGRATPWVG